MSSDSLGFAQVTLNFDILNFRDLGSSIIVVLIHQEESFGNVS